MEARRRNSPRNHTTEAREIMNAALTPNPAEYTSVIVANSTLTQLMNDGLVRPLNHYVEKYGAHIEPHQLITIDGNVMAVAFMANSQHLFARTDILEKAGVSGVPATYEEVLAAAEKIRAAGIMEHPLVMNLKVGWNVGEVFQHDLPCAWWRILPARFGRTRDQQRQGHCDSRCHEIAGRVRPSRPSDPGFERNPGSLGGRSGSAWHHVGVAWWCDPRQ